MAARSEVHIPLVGLQGSVNGVKTNGTSTPGSSQSGGVKPPSFTSPRGSQSSASRPTSSQSSSPSRASSSTTLGKRKQPDYHTDPFPSSSSAILLPAARRLKKTHHEISESEEVEGELLAGGSSSSPVNGIGVKPSSRSGKAEERTATTPIGRGISVKRGTTKAEDVWVISDSSSSSEVELTFPRPPPAPSGPRPTPRSIKSTSTSVTKTPIYQLSDDEESLPDDPMDYTPRPPQPQPQSQPRRPAPVRAKPARARKTVISVSGPSPPLGTKPLVARRDEDGEGEGDSDVVELPAAALLPRPRLAQVDMRTPEAESMPPPPRPAFQAKPSSLADTPTPRDASKGTPLPPRPRRVRIPIQVIDPSPQPLNSINSINTSSSQRPLPSPTIRGQLAAASKPVQIAQFTLPGRRRSASISSSIHSLQEPAPLAVAEAETEFTPRARPASQGQQQGVTGAIRSLVSSFAARTSTLAGLAQARASSSQSQSQPQPPAQPHLQSQSQSRPRPSAADHHRPPASQPKPRPDPAPAPAPPPAQVYGRIPRPAGARAIMQAQWDAEVQKTRAAKVFIVGRVYSDRSSVPDVAPGFTYLESEYFYGVQTVHQNPHTRFLPNAFEHVCWEEHEKCTIKPPKRAGRHDCHKQQKTYKGKYAYDEQGLFTFEFPSHVVVQECNRYCLCDKEQCQFSVAQRRRKHVVEVFETESCGWGVRTAEDLKRGEVLGMYMGEFITREEGARRKGNYIFDLDAEEKREDLSLEGKFSVDAEYCGNWTRFINNSCDPNLIVRTVNYEAPAKHHPGRLMFIANRDIEAGEELTFMYTPSHAVVPEDIPFKPTCYCGAENCRGWY